MKPLKLLASEGRWSLRQRDAEYLLLRDGRIFASSRSDGGEDDFARLGLARVTTTAPRVFVGGLGFGRVLRAVLERLPNGGRVTVSEASRALEGWHRGVLAPLHGDALADPRVTVEPGEAQQALARHRDAFDVVWLDVEASAAQVVGDADARLAALAGLSSARASLRKGGRLAVWSHVTHPGFMKRLREVGFAPAVERVGRALVFLGDV
jgi:spermidine synthase